MAMDDDQWTCAWCGRTTRGGEAWLWTWSLLHACWAWLARWEASRRSGS